MKKQKFAILDMEEVYAYNLMEYLSERQSTPFETLVFGSVESLRSYTAQEALDLLLISAKMMCEEIRRMNIRRIIVLSEGEITQEYGDYPMVYKYQSSESLVAEVMSYYARQEMVQPALLAKKTVNIYAVYSPIGRCGKTCFALTLGQILARKKSVLYINLEDYAGLSDLLEKEVSSDLTDIMYFLRQNRGSVTLKLNAALQKLGNMDYIPPAQSMQDLSEIELAQWIRLLDELAAYSRYETIVLDIGQSIRDVFALLAQCSRIYMPLCTDVVSMAKVAQYEQLLEEMEYGEVLEKTRKLVLPHCMPVMRGEYFLEQLTEGEMGEFVRELMRQEEGYDPGTGGI